ncbi:MAG TPA: ATP-binding cassette domain-containing protein [Gammaproteobacteria bacterium]|nr:ATP-binding cassette domain-containing protein [Gammaproteobacteria bacterium]
MAILHLENFSVLTLKPLNLDIVEGIICLSGPSGAGKSLFLRAIADLIEHKGEASLDQHKCSETNPVQWRKWVGFLPAESAWWQDKIGDHFTKENHDYLAQLNLPQESMSWDVSRCSTGEKQRLAIIRLLEQQPSALLLDEPTASLDPVSVKAVEALITNYSKKYHVPVIWVSHDQAQIKRMANRAFVISNNEIVEVTA